MQEIQGHSFVVGKRVLAAVLVARLFTSAFVLWALRAGHLALPVAAAVITVVVGLADVAVNVVAGYLNYARVLDETEAKLGTRDAAAAVRVAKMRVLLLQQVWPSDLALEVQREVPEDWSVAKQEAALRRLVEREVPPLGMTHAQAREMHAALRRFLAPDASLSQEEKLE